MQGVAPEALDLLKRHPWPGNLRELQGVLKQALIQASGPVLVPEFLPPALHDEAKGGPFSHPAVTLAMTDLEQFVTERLNAGSTELHAEWTALTERHLITRVLRHTGGNLSLTAKILGINRSTLRTKIASLGIAVERTSRARDGQHA
jgi:DNA-binding NtrC family response regulator